MLSIFDGFRDLNIATTAFRLILASVCGGIIGLERELRRRAAGFRTHILICLGASITTLTSEYLLLYMKYYTDVARLGAQVIAGIGFIGAGAIVMRREHIRGLTTAAGMWAAAIVGLSIGAGFYEGGLIATGLILMTELLFSRIDHALEKESPSATFYIEYEKSDTLEAITQYFRKTDLRLIDLEISRSKESGKKISCAIACVRMNRSVTADEILTALKSLKNVTLAEEV
ncbi:MAG: MgtC/SapB family protein [Bilifractor sp.]|jgi:putative Mg2+ transporter-C (MgtC) family protein